MKVRLARPRGSVTLLSRGVSIGTVRIGFGELARGKRGVVAKSPKGF